MPMMPRLNLLPSRSVLSSQLGDVALSCTSVPSRSISKASSRPALTLTMRRMSVNDLMASPSMLTIRSPGLKPAACAGEFGHQRLDPRLGHLLADEPEHQREDDDREQEVGDRPRRHDGRARRQRLGLERALPLGRRQALQAVARGEAGGVLVVQELDVPAKRQPGEAPAGAVPVVEAEDLPAEADGELLHLHAAPARDQKMARARE